MDMRGHTGGFTLIELIIVIMIIGILLTVGLVAQSNLRDYATDRERGDDVASIARRLEQAYVSQVIGGPSYPSTAELNADIPMRTRTLAGISPDALSAPDTGGTPSVVMASTSSPTSPYPGMTASQYVYQPLTASGSLCNANPSAAAATSACVRFYLYYMTKIRPHLVTIASLHQQ